MPRSAELDKLSDDEDRFYGHLAAFMVAMLMLAVASASSVIRASTLAWLFVGWGALVAWHAMRVFARRPFPA